MDVLQLAQILFIARVSPADILADDVPTIRHHVLEAFRHDYDRILHAVARQFHIAPGRSAARMAVCLTVAFGYLDNDELADVLLATVFEAAGGGPVCGGEVVYPPPSAASPSSLREE